jgi:hypothetical protein
METAEATSASRQLAVVTKMAANTGLNRNAINPSRNPNL